MTNGLGREHPQSDPVHGRSSPGGVDHPGHCAAGSPVAIAAGINVELYSDASKFEQGTQDQDYYFEAWIPVERK